MVVVQLCTFILISNYKRFPELVEDYASTTHMEPVSSMSLTPLKLKDSLLILEVGVCLKLRPMRRIHLR